MNSTIASLETGNIYFFIWIASLQFLLTLSLSNFTLGSRFSLLVIIFFLSLVLLVLVIFSGTHSLFYFTYLTNNLGPAMEGLGKYDMINVKYTRVPDL